MDGCYISCMLSSLPLDEEKTLEGVVLQNEGKSSGKIGSHEDNSFSPP